MFVCVYFLENGPKVTKKTNKLTYPGKDTDISVFIFF